MTEPDPQPFDAGSNFEPEVNHDVQSHGDDSPEELLGSMLEKTKHFLEDDSCHGFLTDYVRTNRLPSKFDFENLSELIRCVLGRTNIEKLPIDLEECVNWIANCIYEDPVANERTEILWNTIVSRMQNQQ
ncbi:MAG: hypothetical protein AB8B55_08295 [Mariniblastus sp.]